MRVCLVRFWRSESGATAIEYAVLAGCLAMVIYGSVITLGSTLFDKLARIVF
jgi:Flp pilus assembly pilin Flp